MTMAAGHNYATQSGGNIGVAFSKITLELSEVIITKHRNKHIQRHFVQNMCEQLKFIIRSSNFVANILHYNRILFTKLPVGSTCKKHLAPTLLTILKYSMTFILEKIIHIKNVSCFLVGPNILTVGKNTDKNVTFAFNCEPFVECLRFHEDM